MLNDDELLRYSRQIMLPQWDIAAQEKLRKAKALVVGLGGLGSPAALYLARAGVGELLLADFDTVDVSNLQRQVLHHDADIGRPKVASAADALRQANPGVSLRLFSDPLDAGRLPELVAEVDVVLDCTDNFAIRDALNAACMAGAKPLVSGAAIGFGGQLAVFDGRDAGSPCYRCLYPDADEAALACSEAGVMATVVGVVGVMQAHEALKCMAGVGRLLTGRLWVWDGETMEMRTVNVRKDPMCPVCGKGAKT